MDSYPRTIHVQRFESAIKTCIKFAHTVRFTISMIELEDTRIQEWSGANDSYNNPIGEFLQSFILISLDWRIIWIKIGWCAYIMNEKDRSFAANTSSNQIVHLTMEFAIEPLAIILKMTQENDPLRSILSLRMRNYFNSPIFYLYTLLLVYKLEDN